MNSYVCSTAIKLSSTRRFPPAFPPMRDFFPLKFKLTVMNVISEGSIGNFRQLVPSQPVHVPSSVRVSQSGSLCHPLATCPLAIPACADSFLASTPPWLPSRPTYTGCLRLPRRGPSFLHPYYLVQLQSDKRQDSWREDQARRLID
jgi:hypothetical protein